MFTTGGSPPFSPRGCDSWGGRDFLLSHGRVTLRGEGRGDWRESHGAPRASEGTGREDRGGALSRLPGSQSPTRSCSRPISTGTAPGSGRGQRSERRGGRRCTSGLHLADGFPAQEVSGAAGCGLAGAGGGPALTMGGMAAARCFSCFRSSGFWGEACALVSPVGVRRLGRGDSSLRGGQASRRPPALGQGRGGHTRSQWGSGGSTLPPLVHTGPRGGPRAPPTPARGPGRGPTCPQAAPGQGSPGEARTPSPHHTGPFRATESSGRRSVSWSDGQTAPTQEGLRAVHGAEGTLPRGDRSGSPPFHQDVPLTRSPSHTRGGEGRGARARDSRAHCPPSALSAAVVPSEVTPV